MHLVKSSAASTGRRSQQPNKFLVCPDCEKPFAEGVFKEAAVPLGAGGCGRFVRAKLYDRKGGCMAMKEIITLKDIVVSFDGEQVLDHLNLSIRDGEFVTLLGPSGCGKTTTLRIIGGFVTPDSGDVFFDGTRINDLPAYKRRVNTIFQRYALFPHMNV